MSSNQSRLGRTESQQYGNSGRSNRNYTGGRGSKASGTGSGVGATAAAPSSVNSNSSSTKADVIVESTVPGKEAGLASSQTPPVENLKGEDESVHHNGAGVATSLSADVKEKSFHESHVVKSPVPEKKGKKKRKELLKKIDNNAPTSDGPVQFGGPNPQIQAQAMSSSLPMSMQVPLQNHALPHQMFVPGLQPHPMQSQGLLHQGQNLSSTSHLGPQLPPQLGNVGMNMPPQFPQQQPAKYVPTRKAVKIMHPDTHEELRLDGSLGPRSHSNVPQSHPISSFSPAHTMNYYPTPGNYNAGPIFFPPTTSLPLNNSQPPTSQPPRHYSQVTVKPATGSNVEKDPASSLSSPRADKVESVKVSRPSQKDSHTPTHSIQQQLKPDLGHASSSHVVKSPAASKLGKKKRKELLKKIDNNAPTSDLYLAYKGHEEKKEVATPAEVSDTISSIVDQVPSHAPSHSKASNKNAVQSMVEPEDWEDAAEIPTPKLEASQSGNQLLGSGEDAIGVTKKYSRDFLLIFAEQCTALPEGFEFAPDIAEALMASNVKFSHESYSNTGRNIDRPNAASRLDRRGSGIVDDDKWNKLPGQLMSGRDMRVDNIHGPNAVGFRPNQSGNYGVLRNPSMQAPIQYPAGIFTGPIPNLGPQIVLPRNNADSDRWLRGTAFQKGLMPSPQTPLQMMHKTDNKYEVGKVSDEEQAKQRQLKAILNKLTPQNFDAQDSKLPLPGKLEISEKLHDGNGEIALSALSVTSGVDTGLSLESESNSLNTDTKADVTVESTVPDKEAVLASSQTSPIENLKGEDESVHHNGAGVATSLSADVKEKSSQESHVVKSPGPSKLKKRRKELLKKIDNNAPSDLYLAYKGPEEKKEVATPAEVSDSISSSVDQVPSHALSHSEASNENAAQSKVEPEDWEDAAEIPTPKLEAFQSGNQLLGSGEDAIGVTKKYSRDFLLIFAEQCTALPEGFEFAPNIAEALMASNVNFSHESYSNTGRNIDRPNAASRLDRRGSGIGDDVKWNKFPGQLMTGWDMRVDNTHGPNVLVGQHGAYIIDPASFQGTMEL